MSKQIRRAQAGFTLIEVLVVLILVALLAAAVFPVVTQQLRDGDPVRVARDLGAIKTGVESFNLNVRPAFPGDLEDLAHRVSDTGDTQVTGAAYNSGHVNRWDGPYIDASLTQGGAEVGNAIATGYGAMIQNQLTCVGSGAATTTCAAGTFVAASISGLDAEQFNAVNNLIDGTVVASPLHLTEGKMRCNLVGGVCAPAFYMITPFRSN
jgi:prepilin-type N-terminal cleavage/methylation domain-containing protein